MAVMSRVERTRLVGEWTSLEGREGEGVSDVWITRIARKARRWITGLLTS